MNQKHFENTSRFECKCAFDDRKCNSGQKWNNNTCQWERKN